MSRLDKSDHIHSLAIDSEGRLERSCSPDAMYDEVDRNVFGVEPVEETVEWQDMAASFSMVIDWCTQTKDIKITAGRVHSLALLLWPESAQFASLADIARHCSCTRAALSKSLLEFKDSCGFFQSIGKRHFTRDTFAAAQNRAVENGTQSSQCRVRPDQGNADEEIKSTAGCLELVRAIRGQARSQD